MNNEMKEKIICVSITNELANRANIYDAARKYWALRKPGFQNAQYVLAIYNGRVIGVFKNLKWFLTDNEMYKGRWEFDGEEIPDSEYMNMPVRMYGPVRYFNI